MFYYKFVTFVTFVTLGADTRQINVWFAETFFTKRLPETVRTCILPQPVVAKRVIAFSKLTAAFWGAWPVPQDAAGTALGPGPTLLDPHPHPPDVAIGLEDTPWT